MPEVINYDLPEFSRTMKAVCQGPRTLPAALAVLARSSSFGAADPWPRSCTALSAWLPRIRKSALEALRAARGVVQRPALPGTLTGAQHGQSRWIEAT